MLRFLRFLLANLKNMVLGLSLNSRNIGMAVLYKQEILDYKVQFHNDAWSSIKGKRIVANLQRYMSKYSISRIALYIPHEYYTATETSKLLEYITSFFKKKGLPLYTYEASAIDALYKETRAKKKALMKVVAERYIELQSIYNKELHNKTRYYYKIFEAVAVALLLIAT